jgi:hypothetical protein
MPTSKPLKEPKKWVWEAAFLPSNFDLKKW